MESKRRTFTELIVKGLMLFSIFTIIQDIPVFDSINRIWFGVMSIALIVRLFQYRYTLTEFVMLVLTILVHLAALYFTEFPLYHVNMLFYFLLWISLYLFFAKSRETIMNVLEQSGRYINILLWIWTVLVGGSVFLPSSYQGRYFFSLTESSFRLMPAVLIITALAMYMAIHYQDKRYNWFLLIPTYAAFMNRSRTYFGIYLIIMLMYLYMVFKSKKQFYMSIVPVAVVVVVLMMMTGIADKLASNMYTENSYFDFWGTITSGRTVFWKWDIDAFFGLPFLQQFVGNGFDFVYEVNDLYGAAIWAHNDFINVLMNFGYIGLMIYCWVFFRMLHMFGFKEKIIPALIKDMFWGAVFLNSMFNMSYTYLCAMISYPLFLCVLRERYYRSDD